MSYHKCHNGFNSFSKALREFFDRNAPGYIVY